MPLTSFADNETNALGSQRWLHEVERWGNHTHSLVGGKYHKCIPTLKENDLFSWGVYVNQVTLDALIHPLHPVWILILPCFLPGYHLLLPQNSVRFWFGAINCITHKSPSANQTLHILYVLTIWNFFLGKKLFIGRSLCDAENHLLQFRHAVERFTMYFLFDSFQLPGATIYLLLPLIGSDLWHHALKGCSLMGVFSLSHTYIMQRL